MPAVASATALEKVPSHGSLIRPNVVSVGTIVWLSSELMFFAALFAMYFTVRSINEPNWPASNVVLDLKTAAPFTIILVLSRMIVNGAAVLRSRTTLEAGQLGSLIDRTVKYIANSAAKNISSLESHTIVPTLTTFGRIREPCDGTF